MSYRLIDIVLELHAKDADFLKFNLAYHNRGKMDFDIALGKVLAYLKENLGATNKELSNLIEGDRDLYVKVREHLILHDLAEDKNEEGLIFLQKGNGDITISETGEPSEDIHSITCPQNFVTKCRIFISYGRQDAEELANKIASDLTNLGHDVWLDKEQIRTGHSWEDQIEEAIRTHDIFISLLTPYAVRRPDGICLDEISMARFHNRKIVPVMVIHCRPPLSIFRLDWVDFQEWTQENRYKRSLTRVLNSLMSQNNVEGRYAAVFSKLKPLDFGIDLARMTKDFIGRQWLFDELNRWLHNPLSKVFFLTGDPGIGKSSFMAQMASKHPQVMAFHFCIANLADSINPDIFVRSIASQLATQIKEYYEEINEIDYEQLTRLDSGTLFRRLIADPLKRIELNEQVIILVDGLDEAWRESGNNIVSVLNERIEDLPDKVKIVVSSRRIPAILDLLSKFRPYEFDPARFENIGDISSYLDIKLSEPGISNKIRDRKLNIGEIKDIILKKSEGNFLYIKQFVYGIETDQIDISNIKSFPNGLIGIFVTYFDRLFTKNESFDDYRPILEVITCLKKPFNAEELSPILNLSVYEIRRRMQVISAFFPESDGCYIPFHKSITDWLTGTTGRGGKYLLDMEKGRKFLCEYLFQRYLKMEYDPYLLTYLILHLIECGKFNELVDLLQDFNFIIQRCKHNMVYELINDYHSAFSVLPEFGKTILHQQGYTERMGQYIMHLVNKPEMVQNREATIESLTPWNEKQIEKEIERIRLYPTKRDILTLFLQFLDAHAHLLFRYGNIDGYCLQQAYNYSASGPFSVHLDTYFKQCNAPKLLYIPEQRAAFNPFNPCLRILQEHTASVCGVSLTFDGKYIVSGSNDNSLKIWDLQSGKCLRTVRPHIDNLRSLDATPDLNMVVTSGGSKDLAIRLWNYNDLEPIGELTGHNDRINHIRITPDGRFVISGGNDCTVKVWDTIAKQTIADFQTPGKHISCVDISLDGKIGVSGGFYCIYLWDIPGKKCIRKIETPNGSGYSVKLGINNNLLFSGGGYDDWSIKIWNLESGECIKTLHGHEYAVNCLDVTHDGMFLVSGSMDKTIKVWNLNTNSCIKTIEGHVGSVRSLRITPDMKYIISGGGGKYDNTVRIWDIFKSKGYSEEMSANMNIQNINLPIKGNFIFNSSRKKIQLRDMSTGIITKELFGHKAYIKKMWANAEGSEIISASLDKTIRMWDVVSKKCTNVLEGHSEGILDFNVSTNMKKIVSCGWDDQIIEWNLERGERIKTYNNVKSPVTSVAYFHNDENILSLSSNDTIKKWDTNTGICVAEMQHPVKITTELKIDSNDNLFIGCLDGSIQHIDLGMFKVFARFSGHTSFVSCIEIVEDENLLFSGSKDATVRQWDLITGGSTGIFKGHTDEIIYLRKVPDRSLIVTGSRDHTLRVWEILSCECVAVLTTNLLVSSLTSIQRTGRFAYGTLQGEFKVVDLTCI